MAKDAAYKRGIGVISAELTFSLSENTDREKNPKTEYNILLALKTHFEVINFRFDKHFKITFTAYW